MLNDPVNLTDPAGLSGVGHHWVPQSIWRPLGLPQEAFDVFNKAVSGETYPPHDYSDGHSDYNKAVREMWDDWLQKNNIDPTKMTKCQAEEFLGKVKRSRKPPISGFNKKIGIKRRAFLKGLGPAILAISLVDMLLEGDIEGMFDAAGSIPFGGLITPSDMGVRWNQPSGLESCLANPDCI